MPQFLSLTNTVDVHNVSLVPSDNPLTIREGTQIEVRCVVNSNAYPAPTISWYLGSTNITSTASINKTSIILTGNRQDNNKTLNCSTTNNNKPPKTVVTTLNVECKNFIFREKIGRFIFSSRASINRQTNKQKYLLFGTEQRLQKLP